MSRSPILQPGYRTDELTRIRFRPHCIRKRQWHEITSFERYRLVAQEIVGEHKRVRVLRMLR